MPSQILQFHIEILGIDNATVEQRKLDLLKSLADAIKHIQNSSIQYDHKQIYIKSSFASNLELFEKFPKEEENQNNNEK